MGKPASLRRSLSSASYSITFMIAGAWLLSQYLQSHEPAFAPALKALDDPLLLGFWIMTALGGVLQPPEDRLGRSPQDPSPRVSGSIVVLLTGLAAAIFVLVSQDGVKNYLWPGVIAMATITASVVIWRFATAHAADIGEARFKV